jgi:hypothetical protein
LFPSLSPDGDSLIYASQATGNWDIYFRRVSGKTAINLTQDSPADDTQPAFSPDGESIAFRSERDGGGIFVIEIDQLAETLSEGGQRIAVLAQRLPLKTYETVTWINAGKRAEAFGHDLYANLRALDKAGCARILVQEVPGDERWDAVRDRIARAAVSASSESGPYAALGTGVLP